MNKINIQKAINVMTRAKERDSVYMSCFQSTFEKESDIHNTAKTEEVFHTCGNKACFAGHIAISPEWLEDGGRVSRLGGAITNEFRYSEEAIGDWFGVSERVTARFIFGYVDFYPVPFEEVNAQHVIDKLEELMDLGEEAFASKYGINL